MDILAELAELTAAGSVSSHEAGVVAVLDRRWHGWLSESRTDKLGNFVGLRRGTGPEPRPRVAAAAHMDCVGLMVTRVEEGGFLRVTTVGSVDRRLLLGQEVEVTGRRRLPGVIGAKPPHLSTDEERAKLPRLEEMYVDLGLPEAQVKELVPPGAVVRFRPGLSSLRNGRAAGRYLDDMAGLATIGVALDELAGGSGHLADFYAVGTTGEEVSLAGATALTFDLRPNVAVAVDVTFGAYPGQDDPTGTYPLGGGPTIGLGPNCHPKLVALLREAAAARGVPYGLDVLPGASGTDAWAMQTARGGVPTAIISVPLRYMHSPVETVSLDDIRSGGRLLAEMVGRVDWTLVEELACF